MRGRWKKEESISPEYGEETSVQGNSRGKWGATIHLSENLKIEAAGKIA